MTIYEPPSSRNGFQEYIYLVGGKDATGVLSDVWTWDLSQEKYWTRDFESDQYYRTFDSDGIFMRETTLDGNNSGVKEMPYSYYLDENSHLSNLYRFYVPIEKDIGDGGYAYQQKIPIISKDDLAKINKLGINTIQDLAGADLYTMLKLRGYDYPLKENMTVPGICFLRMLVNLFVEKCNIRHQNFRLGETLYSRFKEKIQEQAHSMCGGKLESTNECNLDAWDGCFPLEGKSKVDVHGLGDIPVLTIFEDPSIELEDMHCRQTPGKRYMSSGAFVDNQVLIFGGMGKDLYNLHQDVWSRDDSFPQAFIRTKPESYTSDSMFYFDSNEEAAQSFEYKIFDTKERLDVTPWVSTTVGEGTSISWLDSKEGGPGSGWYTMFVRALDTSGNRDFRFSIERGNMYTWFYEQPLPWTAILGFSFLILTFVFLAYFEYQRRKRKVALERYALRRMRRKFKLHQMTEGGKHDWKDYYHDRKYKNEKKTTDAISVDMQHHYNETIIHPNDNDDDEEFGSKQNEEERSARRRRRRRSSSKNKVESREERAARRRRKARSRSPVVEEGESSRISKEVSHKGKQYKNSNRNRKKKLRRDEKRKKNHME